MSSIIPFNAGAGLPAYLRNKTFDAGINKDVARGASFPTLSIKGKVFTLVKDNERKVMMRPDDADEVMQNINLSVLRANTKSRVYYAKSYSEEDSQGARPTCHSSDGIAPTADSEAPQSKKCAICAHAVWGSKENEDGTPGKGTSCSVNTRLAVADPDHLDQPLLLRVPAGSRKNFADAVKAAETRGIPYNALVMKVGFDPTAPSPKLTFKLTGLLDDAAYDKASLLYESDIVREIVSLNAVEPEVREAAPGAVDTDELDAAIAAKAAVAQAQAKPAPKLAAPKPVAKPAVKPAPVDMDEIGALIDVTPVPAPAPVRAVAPPPAVKPPVAAPPVSMDNLLDDLDSLLGAKDD